MALLASVVAVPAGAAASADRGARSSDADGPSVRAALRTRTGAGAAWPVVAPARATGATTALIVARTPAYARAGFGRIVWRVPPETTWSGQPMVLLVLESVVRNGRQWLKVRLPTRPTNGSGWIAADHALVGRTFWWLEIERRTRTVRVWRRGKLARRFRAVVGASGTPTPRGLAAVYERNRQADPGAFLGPWAIALTATSRVLQEFDGGPGRIGIHGRGGQSLIDPLGSARSHGCVRVDNADVRWLARNVPLGAPVLVR